LICCSPI
jgi:hypothetical protein